MQVYGLLYFQSAARAIAPWDPRFEQGGRRLQNVSTTRGESRGLTWTAVNESERRNRL